MKNILLKLSTLALLLNSNILLANIPEPDIIFYGKVTTQLGFSQIPIYDGTLTWKILPREGDGKSYSFTTLLQKLANGKYSYQLKIPQSLVVNIKTLQDKNKQEISVESQKSLLLRHYDIQINGEPAVISDSSLKIFTVDEAHRANHQLLNLSVSSKVLGDNLDADNNGLYDAWENLYSLIGADADPYTDSDGDGWTNIQEFEKGTNPRENNSLPVLVGDKGEEENYQISIFEYGLTQLRLSVLDANSSLDNINLIFKTIPTGINIFNAKNLSTPLSEGDKITASTLNNGGMVMRYTPTIYDTNITTDILKEKLVLGLEDTLISKVIDKNISISIVNAYSIAEPLRWIDGKAYKNKTLSKILGRSGYSLDYLALYGYDTISTNFKESSDKFVIDAEGLIDARGSISSNKVLSKLLSFPIPTNRDEVLDLSQKHSIYSVFNSTSTKATTFFNDTVLRLGVDNNYFNYAKTNTDSYGQSTLAQIKTPNIVSLHITNSESSMEYNGISAGGMNYNTFDTTIDTATISGFGFSTGRYGKSDGYVLPFDGRIGEFVVFPYRLEGIDRWKMNAYLLSKWQNYTVSDASGVVSSVRLEIPQEVLTKSILLGGVADDVIIGSAQDDILIGNKGEDSLTGGAGKDRFIVGDGDTIEDFEFNYASSQREDVLDLSELLITGQEDLKSCLYLSSQNSDTVVKVNKNCTGVDFSNGLDFNDSSFTIKSQSLQNSDLPLLWFSGSIYTKAHKPSKIEAKISINGVQSYTLDENENIGENQHYTVDIKYSGEIIFEGDALQIPLLLSGNATPYEDFNLTLKDGYDLLKGKSIGDKIYIPSTLTDTAKKKISLNLTLIKDEKKEVDEKLNIKLLSVPEYYSVSTKAESIDLTLSDGLDLVSIVNSDTQLYEGDKKDFVLQRKGSIDIALLIKLSFKGSAINGVDYDSISEEFIFPANQKEATLTVYGLEDEVSESIENIELNLLENSRYTIDSANSKSNIYIVDSALNAIDTDNDRLLDSWEEAYGLNPLLSNIDSNGVYADSDGDGLSDYEEFIAGTNPKNSDSDGDGVSDFKDISPLDDTKVESIDSLKGYQVIKVLGGDSIKVSSVMQNVIKIPISYTTTTKDDSLNGLKLLVHYNREQLEFLGFSEILKPSYKNSSILSEINDIYRGGYRLYSHQVPIEWSSLNENWPMMPLPTKLLTARFRLKDIVALGEEPWVEFSSNEPAKGYALKPIQFKVQVATLEGLSGLSLGDNESDIDKIRLLTRGLVGMEGSKLLDSTNASIEQADNIMKYINTSSSLYDIDGDGEVNPLVDIVLIYRYMQGTLKEEDVLALLNPNSTRKTMSNIEDAIQRVLAL